LKEDLDNGFKQGINQKVDISIIMNATDLTKEEIEKL
jgi:hypothetical protein